MTALGEARLVARKQLMKKYMGMGMSRADARAVAYTPMSEKGRSTWRNFIGRSQSSEASALQSGTSLDDDTLQPGASNVAEVDGLYKVTKE